jgi:plastocyanin
MIRKFLLSAVVALAVFASGACNDDNNVTGPNPTLTPTPPTGGSTPTPTPPTGPTPTPPAGATRTVDVGAGGGNTFVDRQSSSSTSTIAVGDTIQWVWVSGIHSTTSGTCTTTCTEDGIWDSGQGSGMTFSHTFTQAGTFPYFCEVHGAMMQGTVIVQ